MHLTNLSVFLSRKQILQGKSPENLLGYQWYLHDLGLKKSICSKDCGNFWSGTIGFSGSHDHGTTILSYFLNQDVTQKDIEDRFLAEERQGKLETNLKHVCGQLIQERLGSKKPEQKLEIVKERMAIAAFSSDAGWYCFSSDEWLSEVAKSPFVRSDRTPFHREEVVPPECNTKIGSFIKNINSTFLNLREASEIFWVEIFYSDDDSHLIFVRHISEQQTSADIVCVKIKENAKDYDDEEVEGILCAKRVELASFEGIKFYHLK